MSDEDEAPSRIWTIWSEGWQIAGQAGRAQFLGEWPGRTFEEAVMNMCGEKPVIGRYVVRNYDGSFDYWGCRLFDNEKDAKRSYG